MVVTERMTFVSRGPLRRVRKGLKTFQGELTELTIVKRVVEPKGN
jgi:hypothetical protein